MGFHVPLLSVELPSHGDTSHSSSHSLGELHGLRGFLGFSLP